MLDDIRRVLSDWLAQSTALPDWAQWAVVSVLVWLVGVGGGFTPRAAKWTLGLGKALLVNPVLAWLRRPSVATMMHQVVQTQLHVNDRLAKVEARLNFDGVGGRTVSAEQASTLLGKVAR